MVNINPDGTNRKDLQKSQNMSQTYKDVKYM